MTFVRGAPDDTPRPKKVSPRVSSLLVPVFKGVIVNSVLALRRGTVFCSFLHYLLHLIATF